MAPFNSKLKKILNEKLGNNRKTTASITPIINGLDKETNKSVKLDLNTLNINRQLFTIKLSPKETTNIIATCSMVPKYIPTLIAAILRIVD